MILCKSRLAILASCLTVGLAACGGDSASSLSPTSPSRSSNSGATIVGQIVTSAAPVTSRSLDIVEPVSSTMDNRGSTTVTVVGTGIRTNADNQGQFTLTDVPAGSVQLNFSGPGSNATVTIDGVQAGDQVRISVRVIGNSARVESDHRSNSGRGNGNENDDNDGHGNNNGNGEFEGRIASINTGEQSFVVSGVTIKVPASAIIRHGSRRLQFSDLRTGDHVEVRGTRDSNTITASEVKVEDDRDDEDDNELEGMISNIAGSCPNVSFMVQGTSVTTNSSTSFEDGSCTMLKNGSRVEVKGNTQSNGSLTATRIEFDD